MTNKSQMLRQRAPLPNKAARQSGSGISSPLPLHSTDLHDDESRGKKYSELSRNHTMFLFIQLLIAFTILFLVLASMSRGRFLDNDSFHNNPLQQQEVNGPAYRQHEHIIPRVAYFTYSYNILNTTVFRELPEDEVLANNVRNTIALHPGTEFHFLTDDDCLAAIRKVVDMDKSSKLRKLEDYFLREDRGMIKADVCRGAALFLSGGLYFDVDLQLRMNVWDMIKHDTEFVVPLVHKDHKVKGAFFQAFIGVTPRNQIIFRYLEYFVEYYEDKRPITKTKSKGVVLLREAYDSLYSEKSNDHEFWQEVKFDSKLFPSVEKPVGERRACHFVVRIPGSDNVPFYSRVKGSRMCGGKDTGHKGK